MQNTSHLNLDGRRDHGRRPVALLLGWNCNQHRGNGEKDIEWTTHSTVNVVSQTPSLGLRWQHSRQRQFVAEIGFREKTGMISETIANAGGMM